eukprot:245748-Amphidinium_carterae.1
MGYCELYWTSEQLIGRRMADVHSCMTSQAMLCLDASAWDDQHTSQELASNARFFADIAASVRPECAEDFKTAAEAYAAGCSNVYITSSSGE